MVNSIFLKTGATIRFKIIDNFIFQEVDISYTASANLLLDLETDLASR